MGCIVTCLALMAPRVVMAFILALTDWFSEAFGTWYWPLLGFLFMPYTTLAYMAAILHGGSVSGGWLVLVVVAALVDIGHWGGGERQYRARHRPERK